MPSVSPQTIDAPDARTVRILWRDAHESRYSSRFLRLSCPCAACVNEWTGERTIRPEEVPDDVRPVSWHLVGNYALSLGFSDGHDTGIYSFELLRNLCPCPACHPSSR